MCAPTQAVGKAESCELRHSRTVHGGPCLDEAIMCSDAESILHSPRGWRREVSRRSSDLDETLPAFPARGLGADAGTDSVASENKAYHQSVTGGSEVLRKAPQPVVAARSDLTLVRADMERMLGGGVGTGGGRG